MLNKLRINQFGFAKFMAIICLIAFSQGKIWAQFTRGNIVVCSPAGGTSAGSVISLFQYSPTGTLVNTTTIPSTGTSQLTISGSATSEGFISLSAEKDRVVLVGYDAAAGTAGVASSSVNRVIGTIDPAGTYVRQYSQAIFAAGNARGGTSYGSNFFSSGSNQGIYYTNTPALISTSAVNNRSMNVYAGNVYVSSGSSPFVGISQLGTGISTATGQTETLLATGVSPFQFSISPNGLTLYVADGTSGVTKFTRTTNSGAFTNAGYVVYATPCSGICVDYSTTNPTIYATLSTGLSLITFQDAGSTASSVTTLATTVSTQPFRGISFAPSVYGTISGTTSVCSGSTTTITFSGNPGGLITYNVNGGAAQTIQLDSAFGNATLTTAALTTTSTFNLVSETLPSGTTSLSGSAVVTVSSAPTPITGSSVTCVGSVIFLNNVTTGGTWSSNNTAVATIGATSGILTGISSGTAVITYTLGSGCITTATETINPAVSAITGTGTICAAASATLGDLTTGGTWTSGNTAIATIGSSTGIVTGITGGTAAITYSVAGGCFITSVESVLSSSAGTITGSSIVCNGATTTLTSSSAGGTWSSSSSTIASINSTTGVVTGNSLGSANITYSVTNTCGTYTTTTSITVTTVSVPRPSITPTLVSLCPSSPAAMVYAYGDTITGTATLTNTTTTFVEHQNAPDSSSVNISSIPAGAVITGVSVSFNVNAKSTAQQRDNVFNLRAPNGNILNLDNGRGSSVSGLGFNNVTISSNGTVALPTTTLVSGVNYIATLGSGIPSSALFTAISYRSNVTTWASLFSIPNGQWTLITDNTFNGTEDTFMSWTININYAMYPSVTWSPVAGLFTNTAGTTPYVAGTNTNTVYARPTTTTTYSVTANIGGCTNTATVNALNNASIYVPAITGLSSVCVASNVSLFDSTTGGVWTSGNTAVATIGSLTGVVTGQAAGTAIMTYTLNSGSCTGSSVYTITVNPLPVLPAITGSTNLCLSASTVSLLSNTVTGGSWTSSTPSVATIGAASGVLTAISTGNSLVTYSYSNGTCANTTTVNVTVASSPTSLSITPAVGSVCSSGPAQIVVASGGNIPGTTSQTSGAISFAIGNTAAGVTTSLTVAGIPVGATVTGVSVNFNATESFDGDLELNLIAPNASIINLLSTGTSNNGPNFVNTTISSAGVTPIPNSGVLAPFTGTWAANASSSPTVGSNVNHSTTTVWDPLLAANPNGTWVLAGRTNFSGNTATLTSWTVTINYTYQTAVTWLPVTGLYTNSGATVPYTGTATNTVYALPTTNTIYTANATNGVCVNSNTVNVHSSSTLYVSPITGSSIVCNGTASFNTDSTVGGAWSSSNPSSLTIGTGSGIATGIAPGIATITYTINSGSCSGFATKQVTVSALPVVSPIAGSSTVCSGANITLTNPTTGGTWASGNTSVATIGSSTGIVTEVAPGTTPITYTYSNGTCANSVFTTLTAFNTPTPITVSPSSTSICAGGPAAMLIANGGMAPASITATSTTAPFLETIFGDANVSTINISTIPVGSIITGVSVVFNVSGSTSAWQADNIFNLMAPNGNIINLDNAAGIHSGASFTNVMISSTGTTPLYPTALLTSGVNFAADLALGAGPTVPNDYRSTSTTWSSLYSTPNGAWTFIPTNNFSATIDTFKNWTITINYLAPVNTVWTSSTGLFTDAGATTAYTSTSTDTVFALPAVSSVYTVTATNGACRVTTSVPVTVNPLPANIAGSNAVCNGSTTTLTDATVGGSWTSNDATIASVGASTGIVNGISAGNTILSYTIVSTGCYKTKSITVNPLPAIYTLSGGGILCQSGAGVGISLSGSTTGINYQLYNGTTAVGTPMAGTGSSLNFGLQTIAGVYTVVAINPTTLCSIVMTGSDTVIVNPLPTVYNVTGGGAYCAGDAGVHIGLDGSQVGVNYQIYHGTSLYGGVIAGTGSALDFGLFTSAGSYSVKAINATTGCQTNMSLSADVTINPLPSVFFVHGGGSYCAGGTGVDVSLSGSNTGINYQLYNNGIMIGSVMTGTGSSLDFGMQTNAGYYTVIASDASTSCPKLMSDTARIRINPLPVNYNITGGGTYCPGGTGVTVGLNGSNTGINYQLYIGTSTIGAPLAGTGSALDFGLQTATGIYTIVAKNNTTLCTNLMNGNDTVSLRPLPTAFNITGAGSYCAGGIGLDLGLDNSSLGVNYQLYHSGSSIGSSIAGTGSPLDFGYQFSAGSYLVVGTDTTTTCSGNMVDTVYIVINPLPIAFNVTGGGNYCAGSAGVHVGLDGSQAGVSYQIHSTTGLAGSAVVGTGTSIDFGFITDTGILTVVATKIATGCINNMSGSATVGINPLPTIYHVTGGGVYCSTGTGVNIGLSNSYTGINYQLYYGSSSIGATHAGTGTAISFGSYMGTGYYTVLATDATTLCTVLMADTANVSTIPGTLPITGASLTCNTHTTTLSDATTGGTWSSSNTSIATIGSTTGVVTGITSGTAIMTYQIANGCYSSQVFMVNPLPVVYTITGGGPYCSGTHGSPVGLSGSETGTTYQLYNGATAIGTPLAGIGTALDFGFETAIGSYTVVATNSATGCSANMSATITIYIIPSVTPSVSVGSSLGTSICSGLMSTFTATPTSGGTTPVYQWSVNGTVVGMDSTSYSYVPVNGDIVSAMLVSNATCATIDTVYNHLTMTVTTTALPTVTASSDKGTDICAGTDVIYTATSTFGGSAPAYQWYLNGTPIGVGPTYAHIPTDGNDVKVTMTSNYACRTTTDVNSNDIIMHVFQNYIPVVTITATPGTHLYPGQSVTLHAVVADGGPNPSYQWIKNSTILAGSTTSTYTSSSHANNDSLSCVVKGTGLCGTVSFNSVIMKVGITGVASVTSNQGIEVFPNPNKGSFTVKGLLTSTTDENITLEVSNMLGQIVFSNKVSAANGLINEQVVLSSSLSNGMYMLTLRNGTEKDVIHFVIEQ